MCRSTVWPFLHSAALHRHWRQQADPSRREGEDPPLRRSCAGGLGLGDAAPPSDKKASRQESPHRRAHAEAFDLYSPEIDSDPFPMYQWLRENHPAYWNGNDKYWILSRYEDVVRARRTGRRSHLPVALVDEIPGRTNATLGTTIRPRHDRLRALANSPS